MFFNKSHLRFANNGKARLTKDMYIAQMQGLQFIAETGESSSIERTAISLEKDGLNSKDDVGKVPLLKTRIHRSYTVGISLTKGIMDSVP